MNDLAHCSHCELHETRIRNVEIRQRDVDQALRFLGTALRVIAVASPIVLGIASFVVLVTK